MTTQTNITGKRLPESWEKQTIYKLSNGFKATVEWSTCYGEFVKRLDSPSGETFLACKGQLSADRKDFNQTDADGDWSKFPAELEFARHWIKPTSPGHWQTLMRPEFAR